MMTPNVSPGRAAGLPHRLRVAQAAIDLPEVQEMLRRLAAHNLGILMPHVHDEQTGVFQPLCDGVTQVESGLAVSFQPTADIVRQPDRFLPVGWFWRAGASIPVAACEMAWDDGPSDDRAKHKM